MAIEQLTERMSLSGGRVDREHGVIRGVKILGRESKNGRTYTESAITNGAGLYEGAKVNVNHTAKPNQSRDYGDRIGLLRGVTVKAGGLYGNLHYNPKHALAEQLAWDAENSPEACGLSHNVEARTSRKDGKTIIEQIVAVNSVDLVADPATTHGLYESAIDPDLATLTVDQIPPALKQDILADHERKERAKLEYLRGELASLKAVAVEESYTPDPMKYTATGGTNPKRYASALRN